MIKVAIKKGKQTWAHINGRTFLIEGSSAQARQGAYQGASSGVIESPMPGKVLQIQCKPGDAVETGQTLCVIEAMKMEYSLKAPFSGRVKEILKTPGQQISLGDKILEITKS